MQINERVSPDALPLVVVDVLAIGGVVTVGIAHHASAALLAGAPGYWAAVLLPFLIGWALVSVPVGAYAPGAAESAKAAVPLGVRAWVPAVVVALVIRATPIAPGGVHISFVVVITLLGAVTIAVGRWLALRLV
jgi:hypothetical protein